MKKNLLYLLFILLGTTTLLTACSDDDGPRDPYLFQEKAAFYPSQITIEKSNPNYGIYETWTFAYNEDNTIKSYTHQKTENKNGETTTENKNGQLSYYSDGTIINNIKYKYTGTKNGATITIEEDWSETAKRDNNVITQITCYINPKNGGQTKITSNNFEYDNNHCISRVDYEDDFKKAEYAYKWDGEHKLYNVDICYYNTNSTKEEYYKYDYDKESKDYGFKIEAFVYNNLPHIYAAMGLFGKTTPYNIKKESIITSDSRIEEENHITTIDNNSNNLKVDVESNIYTTSYYVSYTK